MVGKDWYGYKFKLGSEIGFAMYPPVIQKTHLNLYNVDFLDELAGNQVEYGFGVS